MASFSIIIQQIGYKLWLCIESGESWVLGCQPWKQSLKSIDTEPGVLELAAGIRLKPSDSAAAGCNKTWDHPVPVRRGPSPLGLSDRGLYQWSRYLWVLSPMLRHRTAVSLKQIQVSTPLIALQQGWRPSGICYMWDTCLCRPLRLVFVIIHRISDFLRCWKLDPWGCTIWKNNRLHTCN